MIERAHIVFNRYMKKGRLVTECALTIEDGSNTAKFGYGKAKQNPLDKPNRRAGSCLALSRAADSIGLSRDERLDVFDIYENNGRTS